MYLSIFKHLLQAVVLSLVCASIGYGQTVMVRSKTDRSAVGYAHIQLQSISNSGFIKDFYTDEKGVVDLSGALSEARFPLRIGIAAMGYLPVVDTLFDAISRVFFLSADPIMMNPVILTGQYKETAIDDAVHKAVVIDRQTIDRMGAVNLREVLNNSLNIRLEQDNILGSSMKMQGIGGENVKFLVDGVPVVGRLDGNIDLTQFNLNEVERIEIIEGPMAVNFGTNALAGVINIITRKDLRGSLEATSDTYYESNGTYNQALKLGAKKGRIFLAGNAARHFFDGWNSGDPDFQLPRKTLADHSRNKQWKPKEQWIVGLKAGYSIKESRLNYAFDYFDEFLLNRGEPRKAYYETAFDDTYKSRRNNHSMSYYVPVRENGGINLMVARNHYYRVKNSYFKNLTTLEEIPASEADAHDTTNIVAWLARGSYASFGDSSAVNFDVGYDINYERFRGARIDGDERSLIDVALFSSLQYKLLEVLTIRPGLRVAYNSTFKSPLIPSLHLHYRVSDVVFRVSSARGFRAPGLKELYLDFVDINHNIKGNDQLEAEHSHNIQSGIQLRPGNKIIRSVGIEGTFFYNDIFNQIKLLSLSDMEYAYVNIGRFKTHGINLNGEWKSADVILTAGASWIGRINNITATTSRLPAYNYAPEFRLSFMWTIDKLGDLSLFYKYNGKIPSYMAAEDGSIIQTEIDDYSMADVSFTRHFGNKRIALTLGSKNLFNVRRVNSTSTESTAHSVASGSVPVGMGRTWFARLSVNVSKK